MSTQGPPGGVPPVTQFLPKDTYAGRTVLITGGGTGLGLACAKRYCALGGHVCIAARREKVLAAACEEVRQTVPGAKIFFVTLDVREGKSVGEAVEKIRAETGSLPSVIINNAAGNFIAPTETLSTNAFRTIVDIVLIGSANICLEIGKRWIKERSKEGSEKQPQVVFMSVGTSYVSTGAAFLAPSAAAKSGVWSLMQTLSSEWGKYNMRFFMTSPGPIYTEGAFSRLDPSGMFMEQAKDPKKLGQVVPLQRFGVPDEYANFAAFMTSDYASWLSGTNIYFDGGSHTGGGEFQALKKVTPEQWKMMAAMIRSTNKKHKSKSKL